MKKPNRLQLGLNKNYFLNFLISNFNSKVRKKLTRAPTAAKSTVRTKSAELILGSMLNKVPPAVPARV
ncbi:hypothetical protein [Flavobacterium silvisoli]|uniref:hypothetical protein n=1 Tax=Flavobacterium silvisoli TaxID=2529433 RepID=UPI0012B5E989|nr:hypothetical protein [Flavobacterium silvisoli]